MFNIVQRRNWFFLFSGIVIVAGLIAMGISIATYPEHLPVRVSIDFVGGGLFEFQFKPLDNTQPTGQINEDLITAAFKDFATDVRVQRLGNNIADVGTAPTAAEDLNNANRWEVRSSAIPEEQIQSLQAALDKQAHTIGYQLDLGVGGKNWSSNVVSPTVGADVTRAAVVAVIVAVFATLGWIWFAFRQVPDPLRYGVSAILALIHDVLVMVGVMSIMGLVFKWEADALFLTGLLTVVGYSVQDTIVVFDRIRENSARHRGEPFEMIVNRSIMETLQRSLSMQLVVGFVMISLFLIGGSSIHQFVGVLLIGLLSGTYSSTFTAIPILASWEAGQLPFTKKATAAA